LLQSDAILYSDFTAITGLNNKYRIKNRVNEDLIAFIKATINRKK